MNISRWDGRVAVVTGASAGIGAATAVELCKHGLITVGLVRRVEKIEKLRSELSPEQQKNFHAMKCDVSVESEIVETFDAIARKFGGIDVLINNAGVVPQTALTAAGNSEDTQRVIDTNIMGVVYCTREAVKSMRKRAAEGHIIHVNSVAGHFMSFHEEFPSLGVYAASKFAVTAVAEQHRQEFIKEKLNIKVTSLSPGAVKTEILNAFPKELKGEILTNSPFLESKDIADAIVYLLSTPPNVLITELIIRPMNETL